MGHPNMGWGGRLDIKVKPSYGQYRGGERSEPTAASRPSLAALPKGARLKPSAIVWLAWPAGLNGLPSCHYAGSPGIAS